MCGAAVHGLIQTIPRQADSVDYNTIQNKGPSPPDRIRLCVRRKHCYQSWDQLHPCAVWRLCYRHRRDGACLRPIDRLLVFACGGQPNTRQRCLPCSHPSSGAGGGSIAISSWDQLHPCAVWRLCYRHRRDGACLRPIDRLLVFACGGQPNTRQRCLPCSHPSSGAGDFRRELRRLPWSRCRGPTRLAYRQGRRHAAASPPQWRRPYVASRGRPLVQNRQPGRADV